jgi:hypothetical protein
VAKTVADLPRSDLASVGVGDGAHALRIDLPRWLRDGRQHSISLVAPSLGITLPIASGWHSRNRAAPDGTAFAWARHDAAAPPLPSARVLAGTDGWAFPCDDAVGTIEQMLGRLTLTDPELHRYRALIAGAAGQLAELGVPYFVAIAPAKAAVHPERLPVSSPPLAAPRLRAQMLSALAGSGANVIDLLAPMSAAAQSGRQLYYKRDSHWNYEGALIAARTILDVIRSAGVAAGQLPDGDIRWLAETVEGDLAGMPAVALDDGLFTPAQPTGAAEPGLRPDEQALRIRRVDPPPHLVARDSAAAVAQTAGDGNGPRLLVVHDLSGQRLLPFLAACFASSSWLGRRALDADLIASERPSVVVQVLDEPELVRVPHESGA